MKTQSTTELQAAVLPTAPVPMGTIVAFALSKDSIPAGWLLCDGSAIPAQYTQLITALGSNNTPNLAGRTFIGTGAPYNGTQSDGTSAGFNTSNNWPLGYTGGNYNITLAINQIPSHQHLGWGESGNSAWGTGNSATASYYGNHDHDGGNYLWGSTFTGGDPQNKIATNNGTITGTAAGPTSSHVNMQPYYAINYIIYTGA